MKNRKSLLWGLVGLAVIILLGAYFYNEDQKRRTAEAVAIEEQKADNEKKAVPAEDASETSAEKSPESADSEKSAPSDMKAAETAGTSADAPSDEKAEADNKPETDVNPSPSDDSASSGKAEAPAENTSAAEGASPAQTATSNAESAATEPAAAPLFDLVRVEPDGSTIIAGKAKAGTVVEVVAGDEVLTQSEVGQSGDFAAVFEDPLAPGDYEIILRVVEDGKIVAQSEEVATVSVPEENPEALLVIVTKPGEASRIITRPAAPEIASVTEEQPVAKAKDGMAVTDEPANTAAPAQDTSDSGSAEMTATKDVSDDSSNAMSDTDTAKTSDDSMAPAKPKTESGDADASSNTEEIQSTKTKAAEAKTEKMSSDAATESDEPKAMAEETQTAALSDQQDATTEMEKPVSSETSSDASGSVDGQAAAEESTAPEKKSSASKVAAANLRIDAVEIEGGRVFVAGSATPEATVRVYADGEAIGDSAVSSTGRFLVEAQREISVGRHTISADLMMPGSDAATMRVAVPFVRPEGETVAAVATPAAGVSATSDASPADAGEAVTAQSENQTVMAKQEEAAKPSAKAEQKAADADEAPRSTPVAVASEDNTKAADEKQPTEMAKSDEAGQSDVTSVAGSESAEKKPMVTTAETQSSSQTEAPQTTETQSAAEAVPAQTTEKKSGDEQPTSKDEQSTSETVSAKPADQEGVSATAEVQGADKQGTDKQDSSSSASDTGTSQETELAAAETKSPEPETVVQQPLEAKEGSVIIRRGDTLWQISRRVYGRGVRYTTIYLANSDQISNPDFIEPGQVFMVPNEALNNAEQLHRDRIKRR